MRSSRPAYRDQKLQAAFERAAKIPLQIAEAESDLACLAALLVEHGNPEVRADAAAASRPRSTTTCTASSTTTAGSPTSSSTRGDAGNDTGVAGDGLEAIDTGGHDHVLGGDGDDSLDGDQTIGDSPHGGDDELDGGAGFDALDGEAGFDALDGDTGFDTCVNGEAVVNCEAP